MTRWSAVAAAFAWSIAATTPALANTGAPATGTADPVTTPPAASARPARPVGEASGAAEAAPHPAVAFLESIKPTRTPYIAPSDIDERFTTALYVNVATSGPHRQRMWVLHRDGPDKTWRLGMWDENHWKREARRAKSPELTPTYSWPISSGRYYPGNRKAGPTPPGIYGLDERRWRYGRGWLQAGMRHVMHIDYHYGSGRPSGVAFHGTDSFRYRLLGRADSHGCIRMRQELALDLMDRITGRDGVLSEEMRWGEVPRYWQTETGKRRSGYRRDGEFLYEPAVAEHKEASLETPAGDATATATDATQPATGQRMLTKEGFRVIVVFFQH